MTVDLEQIAYRKLSGQCPSCGLAFPCTDLYECFQNYAMIYGDDPLWDVLRSATSWAFNRDSRMPDIVSAFVDIHAAATGIHVVSVMNMLAYRIRQHGTTRMAP